MTTTYKIGRALFDHAINGGDGEYNARPEASSQAFKAGQSVYLASGLLTVTANNATTIYGFAEEDATGTASTTDTIRVNVIRVGDVYTMHVLAAETPSYTMIGKKYSTHQVSNVTQVHTADQTGPSVVIVGIVDAVAGGRVLVTYLPTVIQNHIGA